jgi:hypothetical protein
MTRERKGSGEGEPGLTPISAFLPGIVDGMKLQPAPKEKPTAPPPQAIHHHTAAKQIDALLAIAEDGSPDMGFMTRLLTLCSLPRTNPGSRLQYKRENGPYKLIMIAGGDNKLPFGVLPRLLMAWLCTEAVQTESRELQLGHSLSEFMRQLGMTSDSGGKTGNRTHLRTQIDRLFSCNVELIYEIRGYKKSMSSHIADERELWWDYKQPSQDTLWQSRIQLGEKLFAEIIAHPVPLDMRILKAMRRSPLGLDVYMWLSYKTHALYTQGKKPERLTWPHLYRQFGSDPSKAGDKDTVHNFRKDFVRELKKLKICWPSLDVAMPKGCLEVRPCIPSIAPKTLPGKSHKDA